MDVQIQFGEPDNQKTETLRCTLKAAKAVAALGGSFEVLRRLGDFDFSTYTFVVAAGLNKRPVDVEELVYKTGMPDLNEKLSEYVSILSNGGRPLKKPGEGATEQPPGEG